MSIDRPARTACWFALIAACNDGGGATGSAGFGVTAGSGAAPPAATSGGTDGTAGTAGGTGGATGADATASTAASTTAASTTAASTTAAATGDADTILDTKLTSTGPAEPFCGDGVIDPGEHCDDGAMNGPHHDCYEDCTRNQCGDGVLGPQEDCDLGAMNGPDHGCSETCALLPSACAHQTVQAELIPRPVDIIFVIDNSGSMTEEIQGVQDNINASFAQIIEASGLDYRVIVLSRYGKATSTAVCIEAPLGGIPPGGCAEPPLLPVHNPGKFYHYSVEVDSTDSWCRILSTLHGAEIDLFKFAPDGWAEWLRPDAFKIFVELTDDRVVCDHLGAHYDDHNTIVGGASAASTFDLALRAADPLQFGATQETRNYRFYSITGVGYNDPPDLPYVPTDPVLLTKCPSGVNSGTGYQGLSILTGALRFPLCDPTSYDVVFQALADGVITDAKISCEIEIPAPPEGKLVDEASIEVSFLPMGFIDPIQLQQVADPALCDAMSFYVSGGKVTLCPDACVAAQNHPDAHIFVEFNCEPIQPK